MKCLNNLSLTIVWPLRSFDMQGWTKAKTERWIQNLGGRILTKYTDKTTHVVCDENAWKAQAGAVGEAVRARKEGKLVKIVSPDWLEVTLRDSKRERESHYSWEKLDRAAMEVEKQLNKEKRKLGMGGDLDRQGSTIAGSTKSHAKMLAEVFHKHTDQFLDERYRKEAEEQAARDRAEAIKKAEEDVRRKEEEKQKKKMIEEKALMKRGAKRAKNELFSDNHHIYASEGFSYEVTMTKIDFRHNRNERYTITLQIYESNDEPRRYATNVHFAGTKKAPSNNIIAAIGCNFATAFHAFRKCFQENTGVDWYDHLDFAVLKTKREKRKRRQPTTDQATNDDSSFDEVDERYAYLLHALKALEEPDFDKRPFYYAPPAYGPRGVKSKLQMDLQELVDVGPPIVIKRKEVAAPADQGIEGCVSSANGAEDETQERMSVAAGLTIEAVEGTPNGDTSIFDGGKLDYLMSGGNGEKPGAQELDFNLDDTSNPFPGDGEYIGLTCLSEECQAFEKQFDLEKELGVRTLSTETQLAKDANFESVSIHAADNPVTENTQDMDYTQIATETYIAFNDFTEEMRAAPGVRSPQPNTCNSTLALNIDNELATTQSERPTFIMKPPSEVDLGDSCLGKRKNPPGQVGLAAEKKQRSERITDTAAMGTVLNDGVNDSLFLPVNESLAGAETNTAGTAESMGLETTEGAEGIGQ